MAKREYENFPGAPSKLPPGERPAGLPSSIGGVPPEDRNSVLRQSSWKIVYDENRSPLGKAKSETKDALFSTVRERAMRAAAREVLAQPRDLSSCGVALRKSHIDVGFERPGEVEFRRVTETKSMYDKKPLPVVRSAAENKTKLQMLQKSNIDLAFGVEKTCKEWQSDLMDKFSANKERMYACDGKPTPVDGTRNYISAVQLGDHPPGVLHNYQTETKGQFANPGSSSQAVSYAATLGKELQKHSWDHAMGREKSTSTWISGGKEEMAQNSDEKYQPTHPSLLLDTKLGKELRKSSVYLGRDSVEWPVRVGMSRSLSMPGGKAPIGLPANLY